jgi:hypothetical protein
MFLDVVIKGRYLCLQAPVDMEFRPIRPAEGTRDISAHPGDHPIQGARGLVALQVSIMMGLEKCK